MMEKTKNIISAKKLFMLLVIFAAVFITVRKADAAATDYLDKYYSGTVTDEEGAGMHQQPGSEQPDVLDPDGDPLRVPEGTKVLIMGEEYDVDLDIWYKVSVELYDQTYEGYLYTGRVTRETEIPFTPTPVPTDTPTAEVVVTSINSDPQKEEAKEVNETTKNMIEKSEGLGPWKWIIILAIVIVCFMLAYTLWVKHSEERLEREIERYSGKPMYTPLDGETAEDFAEAKGNYYDHIGLGDQSNKSLGEEIGNPEEVQIDLDGVFEDVPEEKTATFKEDATLNDLLASLESRIGKEKLQEAREAREKEEKEAAEKAKAEKEKAAKAEKTEKAEEAPKRISSEAEEKAKKAMQDAEAEVKAAADEIFDNNKEKEEPKKAEPKKAEPKEEPVKSEPEKKEEPKKAEPATEKKQPVKNDNFDLRDFLDNLNEGDEIEHKVYGKGKVVDNSDSQIVQVQFGKDMRFLKKEKLVKKDLLKF